MITGGASGLGEAITRKLAADRDHRIYFTFCRSAAGAARIESDHPNARALRCDFSDPGSLAQLVAKIPELEIGVLINNALPSMTQRHFHKLSPDDLLKSFEQNVLPTVEITRAAILEFRKRKRGKVITVLSSYLVNRPPTGLSEYVANKAYLASMSRSWATENAAFNITSNCISPSLMRTSLTSDTDERVLEDLTAAHPFGKLLTPAEVAASVAFLVGATEHINGINLVMNGGADVI